MSIFTARTAFKPYEYPEVDKYKEAIQHAYWLVQEFNFTSDVDDFKTRVSPAERDVLKKTMLAISQIEVAVKSFWGRIDDHLPKPEIAQVGATFADSEVRHADAYSKLLQVLGINSDFENILNEPVIAGRVAYLKKYLAKKKREILTENDTRNEDYTFVLTMFALFVENVSLFSQFAIMKSFNKHKNLFKGIDNVIQATMVEENIHALFGAYLVNQIKKERPEFFDAAFNKRLRTACTKAYNAEANIVDWIFAHNDLSFLTRDTVKEFLKQRFNESLALIGEPEHFVVDPVKLAPLQWLVEELHGSVSADFFHKRPTAYSARTQSFTAADLF